MAFKITVTGIVQGVGFRPYAARLADSFSLCGYVRNTGGIVEIFLSAGEGEAKKYMEALSVNPPPASIIKSVEISPAENFNAQGFFIAESEPSPNPKQNPKLFPPDLGMCPECCDEILDSSAPRRYGYWFNSCVNCGPRYTIIERFPYDRVNTTMKNFALCENCAEEYANPSNRRFHAETVCCNNCEKPELMFFTGGAGELTGEAAFKSAEAALSEGKIIAVKGMGGYHLMCRTSPLAEAAVREIKGRDTKPFANLFYEMEDILRRCEVSDKERELLTSPARPIVLLKPREGGGRVGAFLPYTPLHKLLLKNVRRAAATSLNRGGAPIIIDDGEALAFFNEMKTAHPIWSGVLYNDRPIVRRAEDSVVEAVGSRVATLRRARGYAPLPFEKDFGGASMLALGGDLKTAFGIYSGGNTIVSPYCGDTGEPEASAVYKQTVDDLLKLFEVTPRVVVADPHPRYFTHAYAKELAGRFNAELKYAGHHHAHIASVMAEHGLEGKVLGAAFDGAGYGDDGAIWGGEFLLCEGNSCRRLGHLEYINLLGSDSAARDALKTAECYLYFHGLSQRAHEQGEIIRTALEKNINVYKTSSMGRLFDAAAALLGLCNENTYEGECAVSLQYAAEEAVRRGIPPAEMSFDVKSVDGTLIFGHKNIIKTLADARGCVDAAKTKSLALGFHMAAAEAVHAAAENARITEKTKTIALSGGVFQNALLAELTERALAGRGFDVFMNENYPANDGGLCLGQELIACALRFRRN